VLGWWRNGHFRDFLADLDASSWFDSIFSDSAMTYQYDADQAFFVIVPNILLSNPGSLIRRSSKVMAGSVHCWRKRVGFARSTYIFRAFEIAQSLYRMAGLS